MSGKAQQIGGIHIFREGAGHHRKKLPEQKYGPEQHGKPFRFSAGNEIPRGGAKPDRSARAAPMPKPKNVNHARDDFQAATNGAQGVYEKLPADAGDGGKLAAYFGRDDQPSHESSWSARRVPPTMRRKICSRVSFSTGSGTSRIRFSGRTGGGERSSRLEPGLRREVPPASPGRRVDRDE